jgi:hypothetical protein
VNSPEFRALIKETDVQELASRVQEELDNTHADPKILP